MNDIKIALSTCVYVYLAIYPLTNALIMNPTANIYQYTIIKQERSSLLNYQLKVINPGLSATGSSK